MAELRPYEPTWRDRIARALMGDAAPSPERRAFVEGLTGSSGLGATGMGLVDITPAGVPLAAQEAAKAGDARGVAMAIVPPIAASKLGFAANAGKSQLLREAAANTPGASFVDDVLRMRLARNQTPDQAGMESVRGGVFYLPEGSPQMKFYRNQTAGYGGKQPIVGETDIYNPLVAKGATGGRAPASAYDELLGKGAYEDMRREALSALPGYGQRGDGVEKVYGFLDKRAPEMADLAYYIMQNSKGGNLLPYALQEAAVGSAARNAGYDSIVGYSQKRGGGPFISEVYDLRENRYPTPGGGYSVWDGLFGLGSK